MRYAILNFFMWCAMMAIGVFAILGEAKAQMLPFASGSVVSKTTMTGSFISIAPRNFNRKGCLLQNNGANKMFVFLDNTGGATPPADTTTSFQLAAGQTFNCNIGGTGVVSDELWISGTSADVAVLALQ